MSNKGKYIGISNRIPIAVLEFAVNDYINKKAINSLDYFNYIKEYTKGENRAKKTLTHLTSIINKNTTLLSLISKKTNANFLILSEHDRKAILLCLYSLTFPITYDILNSFAVSFKVQQYISKRAILEKIGAIYGSNRSMHIALDETISTFIEVGIIARAKYGIYEKKETLKISNQITNEIVIYTDLKLSASKSILADEFIYRPWYIYFDLSIHYPMKFSTLLENKEGSIGKGYIIEKK